ncbi:MAG TPA: Glu-tRNA(Gln) amidotransferase subunit GatD [Methanoregulaceae archaeon]|nr:Glu-tRNA(Gln) amidotransferase subunit GatD [Methanoregulaceae archaeon]
MEQLETGDRLECAYGGITLKGTFITVRDGKTVVKLDSGYNIGISREYCRRIERSAPVPREGKPAVQNTSLPVLSIISTGGTIASRIDYRTGAVTSQFDADDILRAIPGLSGIAQYRTRQLYTILSENMTPAIWQELATAIYEEIRNGATGIIVTHGTDTMAYSAAAVSFMLDTPVPVVFVGSQRSADRPSSDNTMNALCSAAAAVSQLGEVVVVMHASTSDDRCAIHRATRVRKMHTSRRDAFQSIGSQPLGYVEYPSLDVRLSGDAKTRTLCEPGIRTALDENCRLVYFYPGMPPEILPGPGEVNGLVLGGTGLGHVSTAWIPALGRLIDSGTEVMMTSQCLHGRVCDRVYDTGRDLIDIGVIEGEDTLPEAALVKMMWVLGNEKDREKRRKLLSSDLRGEYNKRSFHGL